MIYEVRLKGSLAENPYDDVISAVDDFFDQ